MSKQKKQISDDEKKIKVSTLVYAILILAMISIAVMSILAFGTSTQIGGRIEARLSKIFPYPAAIVNWKSVIFVNDVKANLASVEKFYATQNFASEGLRIDFSTEDGKKRLKIKEKELFNKMVEDRIIQILAKKQGILVTDVDADNIVSQKLNEFGTADDVKSDLKNSYGWDLEDFKRRVVLPSLYSEALSIKIAANDTNFVEAKSKIEQAKKELIAGKDFEQVVRSYSQGASKENGGELGWVKKQQVAPELQEKLFGKESFEKNSIMESSIGFHIFDIENSKKEDGVDFLQLRQIFVSKDTFVDWLEAQKKEMNIVVPYRDYVWNKDTGSIDFRDEKMRAFEKEGRAKSQGDASIMY